MESYASQPAAAATALFVAAVEWNEAASGGVAVVKPRRFQKVEPVAAAEGCEKVFSRV